MITKKPNGLYEVRVHIRKGKAHAYRRKSGIRTEREARQIERDLHKEAGQTKASVTLAELVEQWRHDPMVANNYSPGTLERYYYSMQRGFVLDLGLRLVMDIATADLIDWLNKYCIVRGLSQNTKAYQKKLLNCMFVYAALRAFRDDNPAAPIRLKEVHRELPLWSKEQLETFLAGVKKLNKDWYHVFALASLTGMRAGELIALRWESVDLTNNVIRVCEVYDHKLRLIRVGTKNAQVRVIPINRPVGAMMTELHGTQRYVLPRLPELLGGGGARVLKHYASLLGLPPIRFHDLRAIFACQLALSGTPMHVIKAICGWSNLSVVQRYLRISGAEIKGATDKLDIKI